MLEVTPNTRMVHKVQPIPAPMRAMMEHGKIYIFNVGPWRHEKHLGSSLGRFLVPACPEGEEYSAPVEWNGKPGLPSIFPELAITAVNGADVQQDWEFRTGGAKVALDILGRGGFTHASNDLTRMGVFLAAGPIPTEAELDAAREKLHDLYDERVKEADSLYEINGGMVVGEDGKARQCITRDHVDACKALGLDRPWAKKNVQMVSCEGCGQSVRPNAVRCHHEGRGAILNEEKARKLFPHLYAHEAQAEAPRVPGRPRKDAAA